MTPAQVAHIMALVTELCADCARAYCEQLYGTSETYTKLCCEKADKSRVAVEAALRDAPQAEPTERTGNPEVDRVLDRLDSSDPDFDDCAAAAALIYKLEIANRGPEGFATWKEAAMHERKLRLAATPSAPTAVEPDERAMFEVWWATMNEAPYYPGIEKRIAEHAFKAGRASKGTPL